MKNLIQGKLILMIITNLIFFDQNLKIVCLDIKYKLGTLYARVIFN